MWKTPSLFCATREVLNRRYLGDGVVIRPGILQLVGEIVDRTRRLFAGDEEVGGCGGEAGDQQEGVFHGEQGSLEDRLGSVPLDAGKSLAV